MNNTDFTHKFTVFAWLTLLFYVFYCTHEHIADNSKERILDILIFIASYYWGSSSSKSHQSGTISADVTASVQTEQETK